MQHRIMIHLLYNQDNICSERREYATATHNECMQDTRSNSYEQHVSVCKHVYTNKFIMITFPEKLSIGIPICVTKKCM